MEKVKKKVIHCEEAQKVLLNLGIYPSKKGYMYLLASIQAFRETTNPIMSIYKEVGEMFGVKPICVERCIRFVVTEAYYLRSFVYLNECFKTNVFKRESYLSNGSFISMIALYLDMIDAPRMIVVPYSYSERR